MSPPRLDFDEMEPPSKPSSTARISDDENSDGAARKKKKNSDSRRSLEVAREKRRSIENWYDEEKKRSSKSSLLSETSLGEKRMSKSSLLSDSSGENKNGQSRETHRKPRRAAKETSDAEATHRSPKSKKKNCKKPSESEIPPPSEASEAYEEAQERPKSKKKKKSKKHKEFDDYDEENPKPLKRKDKKKEIDSHTDQDASLKSEHDNFGDSKDSSKEPSRNCFQKKWFGIFGERYDVPIFLALCFLGLIIIIVVVVSSGDKPVPIPVPVPVISFQPTTSIAPSVAPSISPAPTMPRFSKLTRLFENIITDVDELDEKTPQYMAFNWLVNQDPAQIDFDTVPFSVLLERYVMAVFYFSAAGPQWTEQLNFLSGKSICSWRFGGFFAVRGVVCEGVSVAQIVMCA
jgi:hypothetical protein